MTIESFRGCLRGPVARSSDGPPVVKRALTCLGPSAIHSRPFPAGPRLVGEQGPEPTRHSDAREHPSRLSDFEGPLRLRRHVGDPLDRRGPSPGHLLQLPPLLHRQAEADRYPGPHRPVPEEVRERAEGAAEEGQGRGREEADAQVGEEVRQEAEEAQGRSLARKRRTAAWEGASGGARILPPRCRWEGLGGPSFPVPYFSRAATLLRPSSSL